MKEIPFADVPVGGRFWFRNAVSGKVIDTAEATYTKIEPIQYKKKVVNCYTHDSKGRHLYWTLTDSQIVCSI